MHIEEYHTSTALCFSHTQSELSLIFFMSKAGQKEEINSGFGEFDQVNRPQSRGRLNKDTVSLLVQHSVMHPYWDQTLYNIYQAKTVMYL